MSDRSEAAVFRRLEDTPNLMSLLRRTAKARPRHPAVEFLREPLDPSPKTTRYADLLAEAETAAAAFRRAGVGPQDGVAIVLPALAETVAALVAASTVGVAFPINLLLSEEALAFQLALARAKVAVVPGPLPGLDVGDRVRRAAARAVPGLTVVELPIMDETPGALSWRRFLDSGRGGREPAAGETDPDRIAALFHTGGTTGAPKLAELSQHNLIAGTLMAGAVMDLRADDRLLSGFPLFHVGGAIDLGFAAIAAGATVVFPTASGARHPRFAAEVWKMAEQTRATVMGLAPTSLASAAATPLDGARLDALRCFGTGAAPLPPTLGARLEAITGVPVRQIYGMTETSGIIAAQPLDRTPREPAVGFAPPMMRLRIGAPDGPWQTRGEVFVSGPNVFQGYRTEAGVIGRPVNGWVASGDLGEIGADGQLRLFGRSKDVIIRGGHNVDPLMIEDIAVSHPAVLQAGAVPMPDAYAGELPVLYVSLKPGVEATGDEISAFVAERIADAPARPKQVFVVPEIPLTLVGKVARFKLRQQAAILRAGQALEGLPVEALGCEDPVAKRLDLAWAPGASEADHRTAAERLGELGLSL